MRLAWSGWQRRNRDLAVEIETHFRMAIQDRIARGEDAETAARAVRREFGNRLQVEETTRAMWRSATFEPMIRHLRHALRDLRRSPGFSTAVVLTLAVGVGGLASIASLVHAVLLRPLPYPDSGRLFSVAITLPKIENRETQQSDAMFFALERLNRTAVDLGASLATEVNLGNEGTPERLLAARVSAGFFRVLMAVPAVGRTFSETEDSPPAPPVVVLGESLWRRRFGGARDVVGNTVLIDGQPHQVIGVMPSSMALPHDRVELWLPLALDPAHTLVASSTYDVIARLEPNVPPDLAQRDFQHALARMSELYPDAGFGMSTEYWMSVAGPRVVVRPLRETVVGDIGTVLWVLLGTAVFVLLAACANVGTLFLVRAESRQCEMAVRSALGASRRSLIAGLATEGALLGTLAAVVGVGLATACMWLLSGSGAAGIPRLGEVGVGGSVIGLVLVLTILVGLGCSILPPPRITPRGVASVVHSGRRVSPGDRQRTRELLVVAQVALAFALLAGSGLLARTVRHLRAVRPGFSVPNVLTLPVALPEARYSGVRDVAHQYRAIGERLAALPGVRTVGMVSKLPLLRGGVSNGTVLVEDRPDADITRSSAELVVIEGDYFQALAIPRLAGRWLGRTDDDRPSDQALVSLGFARREWGDSTGRAAIGRRIGRAPDAPWLTVVGVVGDIRATSLERPPEPTVYLPINSMGHLSPLDGSPAARRLAALFAPRAMSLVLEGSGDPEPVAEAARAAIRALDPAAAVFDFMPMSQVLSSSLARTSFTGALLGMAAALTLLLGVIGVYGVVAYSLRLRSREIGLRLALGAGPARTGLMLVRQAMIIMAAGMVSGLILTLLIGGALGGLLVGVTPNDPITLGVAALMLTTAIVASSLIPAWHAGRIDPRSVLGGE